MTKFEELRFLKHRHLNPNLIMRNKTCSGCLVEGRQMKKLENKNKECYLEIITNISTNKTRSPSILLCWECSALISRFLKFKAQVIRSYQAIQGNVKLTDVKPYTRLNTIKVFNLSFDPNENECEVKEELKLEVNNEEDVDTYLDDDIIESPKEIKKEIEVKDRKDEIYIEVTLTREELEEEREMRAIQEQYVHAMYKCEKCITTFPNEDDFADHVNNKHNVKFQFKCDICECTYRLRATRDIHKARHSQRFQCLTCGVLYQDRRSVAVHYNTFHCVAIDKDYENLLLERPAKPRFAHPTKKKATSTKFQCDYCQKSFSWRTSLAKHIESHNIESGRKRRPFCATCNLSFKTKCNLQKHVKSSLRHQMGLKDRNSKESADADVGVDAGVGADAGAGLAAGPRRAQFPCTLCGATFLWRGNLVRHLQSHAAKAQGALKCDPCKKTFSSIATYQQHMSFSKKHITEDLFKYMCSDCGKRFAKKHLLVDHVNWEHLKQFHYKCSTCSKVFKNKTTLYLHKRAVHLAKTRVLHLCDYCGKNFSSKSFLSTHIRHRHSGVGAETHVCEECGMRFSWLSCLCRHRKKAHPELSGREPPRPDVGGELKGE